MERNEFLNKLLKPFKHEIKLWNQKVDKIAQTPEPYIYDGTDKLYGKNTRSILPNELVFEWDFTSQGNDNPEQAKLDAKYMHDEAVQLFTKLNYIYHVTNHGGKCPHIRVQIPGLEAYPVHYNLAYKKYFRQSIIKRLPKPSELVQLDMDLISTTKGIPLEGGKHYKYNSEVKIVKASDGIQKIKKDIMDKIIRKLINEEKEFAPSEPLDIADIKVDKLKEFFDKAYTAGKRNKIILAFAGMMHRKSLSFENSCDILKRVWNQSLDDTSFQARCEQMRSTFKKDPVKGVSVTGHLNDAVDDYENILLFYNSFPKKERFKSLMSLGDFMKLDIPPLQWLVEDIIPDAGVTFVAGSTGIGKTNLMLHTAFCILTGSDFFGKKTEQRRVGIIDEEVGDIMMKDKFEKFMQGFDTVITNEHKQNLMFSTLESIKIGDENDTSLEQWIEKANVDVVIIDPFVSVKVGEENSNDDTRQFFEALKRIQAKRKVTFIITHHLGKGAKIDKESMRGAGDIGGLASSVLILEKKSDDVLYIHNKKNRATKEQKPIPYELITNDDDSITLQAHGFIKSSNQQKEENMKKMLTDFIQQNDSDVFDKKTLSDYVERESDIKADSFRRRYFPKFLNSGLVKELKQKNKFEYIGEKELKIGDI